MENRIWKVIGFWAMGLLLLMATMIIIRWVVDFVTWSTLDSGWAQAIGAIAALAVAIYVMSRQNQHAAKLLIDADMLAYRRRTAAVKAIVERAETVAAKAGSAVAKIMNSDGAELASETVDLNAAKKAIDNIHDAVKAIPTYELGSYDMAEGTQLLAMNLESLSSMVALIIEHPTLRKTEGVAEGLMACITALQTSKAQFDRGAAEFS